MNLKINMRGFDFAAISMVLDHLSTMLNIEPSTQPLHYNSMVGLAVIGGNEIIKISDIGVFDSLNVMEYRVNSINPVRITPRGVKFKLKPEGERIGQLSTILNSGILDFNFSSKDEFAIIDPTGKLKGVRCSIDRFNSLVYPEVDVTEKGISAVAKSLDTPSSDYSAVVGKYHNVKLSVDDISFTVKLNYEDSSVTNIKSTNSKKFNKYHFVCSSSKGAASISNKLISEGFLNVQDLVHNKQAFFRTTETGAIVYRDTPFTLNELQGSTNITPVEIPTESFKLRITDAVEVSHYLLNIGVNIVNAKLITGGFLLVTITNSGSDDTNISNAVLSTYFDIDAYRQLDVMEIIVKNRKEAVSLNSYSFNGKSTEASFIVKLAGCIQIAGGSVTAVLSAPTVQAISDLMSLGLVIACANDKYGSGSQSRYLLGKAIRNIINDRGHEGRMKLLIPRMQMLKLISLLESNDIHFNFK